jgi:spermidine synthase
MRRTWSVAGLLFLSGMCALIYQTVWMREFRLVFGASTSATAAVLAIFMGGLGIGSALFGKRADRRAAPLNLYANFEFAISASAAASLPLLWLVRQIYLAMGGSVHLGLTAATAIRLLLAAVVLAIPTLAMGGTLPAAARAVETDSDTARRSLALLYGLNTLGAVFGTLLSTFFMLETFGNRKTLLVAVLVNVLVAVTARSISRSTETQNETPATTIPAVTEPSRDEDVHPRLVLIIAALAGFAFLLMELVWYRMLGPLLGGTSFTFGLILAMALFGIGAGGLAYSAWNRATLGGLALTTAAEALALVLPFALGDRLALLANVLRRLGDFGFDGHVLGWAVVAAIVVFPAAFVAGVQFPLLIALLGRGTRDVGRHVGLAYAWNTAGSIVGSLAGGFGLLPLLSAPGAWRAVTWLLAAAAVALAVHAMRQRAAALAAAAMVTVAIVATFATGPTALWRHSAIGVGRLGLYDSINEYRAVVNERRAMLIWDVDGRESSVALMGGNDLSMIFNGKSDGSAIADSGTQVMSGLIGALIHGAPKSSLVVGLGTGSTAGWLATVPSMQRVDVVELEPVALDIAEACAAVNQNVLAQPNVRIQIGDAREVLLVTRERYDLIFSEPSNPYRAGIASLYTREFYDAASKRLNPGGIFLQWMQAYDIDPLTLRTIYATISQVFPNVQTYWTSPSDLILLASAQSLQYDAGRLRQLLLTEPYRSGMRHTWRVDTLEGFFSHFAANEATARLLAEHALETNTDDRTIIEFSFARAVNARHESVLPRLRELARSRGENRPLRIVGAVDWNAVEANRMTAPFTPAPGTAPESVARFGFSQVHRRGDLRMASALWRQRNWTPVGVGELTAAAEALAEVGDERAAGYAAEVTPVHPVVAHAVLARLRFRQGRIDEAVDRLQKSFVHYRRDPWADPAIMRRAVEMTIGLARISPPHAAGLYDALRVPFAAGQLDFTRRAALVAIASSMEGCGPRTIEALGLFEPHVRWRREHLLLRAACYAKTDHALAAAATKDWNRFVAAEEVPLAPERP